MPLSLTAALATTLIMALIIFATRVFPFALFSKREPPSILRFIEKYIPPMIMAILLMYCLKDVSLTAPPFGLPQLIALSITVASYLWKGNSMVSIFGGTIAFMLLQNSSLLHFIDR